MAEQNGQGADSVSLLVLMAAAASVEFALPGLSISIARADGEMETAGAGLAHYRGRDFLNRRHYEPLAEALEKFRDRPTLFAPGDGFAYSSFGWNLLGLVMERASGRAFLDLMEERVFEPMELFDTAGDRPPRKVTARPVPP